jgi:serine/threonine protein kinase
VTSASPIVSSTQIVEGPPPDPDDLSGSVLGAYRLVAQIGVGGIGHVYRAEHVRLARQVAIKRLRPEYAAMPSVVQRFFAEARAANQIAHENIVEITDFVEDDPGGTYLIMELLKGEDLGGLLTREPVLALDRTVRILVQVARALRAAHAAGIVHRDLKPDNIFLIERAGVQDFVKLLDFGVAKLTQESLEGPGVSHRTAVGSVLGTPAYMAPEQATGQATDHRIDIYAMGVIMYELVTGELPFSGNNLGEFIIKHSTMKVVRPSKIKGLPHTIPDAFEKLIMRCLEKAAEERPQTMEEVEGALLDIADAQRWPLEAFAHSPSPAARRGSGIAVSSLALAAAVSLFVFGLLFAGFVSFKGGYFARFTSPSSRSAARSRGPVAGAVAPARIALSFESVPSGAEVWREGVNHPLGITPFELRLARAPESAPVAFEFRFPRHRPVRYEVTLGEDRRVVASLGAASDVIDASADPGGDEGDEGEGDSSHRHHRSHTTGTTSETTGTTGTTTNEIDRHAVIDPFNRMQSP